jgi:hypothetical protein
VKIRKTLKEVNQMINENQLVRGVSYETEPEKTYLILIEGEEISNGGEPYRDWQIITGRQDAYDYIKNYLESDFVSIDVYKSKIIVSSEKVKVTDGITIYEFMKVMKEKEKVIDYSSFDIDEYIGESVEEGEQ